VKIPDTGGHLQTGEKGRKPGSREGTDRNDAIPSILKKLLSFATTSTFLGVGTVSASAQGLPVGTAPPITEKS
jgi:hypothetical protein